MPTWKPPTPHLFVTTLTSDLDNVCGDCQLLRTAPCHIDAPGRTPQRADAGETSRESHPHRARSKTRTMVYDALVAAAWRNDPACDRNIELDTGLSHQHASGARNGLCIDGLVAPIFDPDGKTNPLKVKIGKERVTVSNGPWRTKANPDGGPGRFIVWVPIDGPWGGYRHQPMPTTHGDGSTFNNEEEPGT